MQTNVACFPRHNGINTKTADAIYLIQKYKYC